jgi:hypothetical protein
MRRTGLRICLAALLSGAFSAAAAQGGAGAVSGELKKWHRVTVTFDGPAAGEGGAPNPFRDYRLNVTFTRGTRNVTVPGYFAADGNAGETGAAAGTKWRAHFAPDEEGTWSYRASFRTGADIAASADPNAGAAAAFDGASGSFSVGPTDKSGRDHRGKGRLRYVGRHHLQFAQTGEFFLKGGADSPENFLAYGDFDQTPAKHAYAPHAGDWQAGDPTWKSGKGKNIIGALNYLSGKGMNSVYFLTMNVGGDGNDVWPWTSSSERYRFDVSKLDQWEVVFSHMDRKGILLHVITQETENDQLLDGGALGLQRKLYYRELVARFGHHLAIVWNLGEENTNTDAQRKAFADYLRSVDPYDHPIVVHTYPGQYDAIYTPLLGYGSFEGPSLQTNATHSETVKWVQRSAQNGRPWFVSLDEIGPADVGVVPDADDFWHDAVRKNHLWGNLMGGGAGCEWYFGYGYPHNDLNCEDWRSRDHMWTLTRIALDFFRQHLPFQDMAPADGLVSTGWCLARPGSVYALYLPNGGSATLQLAAGTYSVQWYDPRAGGALRNGSVTTLTGGAGVSVGNPPSDATKDWAVLVKLTGGGGGGGTPSVTSFTLVNADTDQDIGPLANGATLNLAALPTRNLNVRANTEPATVGSVRFELDGNANYSIESAAPYALAGDASGDYNAWTPAVGSHSLRATPYTGAGATGTAGTALSVVFEVADGVSNVPPTVQLTAPASGATYTAPATIGLAANASDADGSVAQVEFYSGSTLLGSDTTAPYGFSWSGVGAGTYTLTARAVDDAGDAATSSAVTVTVTAAGGGSAVVNLTLIDADTDQPMAGFDPLNDGAVLNLGTLPTRNWNLRANTVPATVGSVRFGLDGNPNYRTESAAPYALAGDSGGNYAPWTPAVGPHSVEATPYELAGGGGSAGASHLVTFTVLDDPSTPSSNGSGAPSPGPAPADAGGGGGGGGGCGATGAEMGVLVWLLAWVRHKRRRGS